jgi:carbon storage regulator
MLVLSRKLGQSLLIDHRIRVMVCEIVGDKVRVGVDAPRDVLVLRSEIADDGRPARPPALPDVHTEVERMRRELAESEDRRDEAEAMSHERCQVIHRLVRENSDLCAELVALRAEKGEVARLVEGYVNDWLEGGQAR